MALRPLIENGWLCSSVIGDAAGRATNYPSQGRERCLDGIMISPAVARFLAGIPAS